MKHHGCPMKMFCLMLLGGIALGLSGCANQGPTAQDNRQGYEEPAAWVPAK